MQAVQTIGIDLPLKILAWQGEDGTTSLAYNDPVWLAQRHSVGPGRRPIVEMAEALAAIVAEAATYGPERRTT
jgi:uncharacterized protein (DUF302 family)